MDGRHQPHDDPDDRPPIERRADRIAHLPLVVASVGTDHHRFDRLVGWIDTWAGRSRSVRVVIQRGTAAPAVSAESAPVFASAELLALFAEATAVVCHGGPSTVMDVRAAGLLPIVVPRDPALGEHVDGHQLRFADHLARHGLARVVTDRTRLESTLDAALAEPDRFRLTLDGDGPVGVSSFASVVDSLLGIETPAVDGDPDQPIGDGR